MSPNALKGLASYASGDTPVAFECESITMRLCDTMVLGWDVSSTGGGLTGGGLNLRWFRSGTATSIDNRNKPFPARFGSRLDNPLRSLFDPCEVLVRREVVFG